MTPRSRAPAAGMAPAARPRRLCPPALARGPARCFPGPGGAGGAIGRSRDSGGKSSPDPVLSGEYLAVEPESERSRGLREGDLLIRRYRLLERLAEGGMSAIWRAFDESIQRTVAIKVQDGPLDGEPICRELIRREARTAARLHHPDVIEVYDYGETVTTQGRIAAFVVMRLLEGRPLAERLQEGPLPWWEAARLAERIALVLALAHERGIVHRDVTPENVLLTPEGPKLIDFGIAAITGEEGDERLNDYGTPPYVAPERLRGVTADPAIDVYALGVMLFEMFTGELPYPERTWEALEVVRRIGPPPTPEVPGLPPELARLCRSCLSQNPEERPSAQQAAEILARAAARRRRRHIRPAWAAISGLAVVALAAGIAVLSGIGDRQATRTAGVADGPVARPPARVPEAGGGVPGASGGDGGRAVRPAEPRTVTPPAEREGGRRPAVPDRRTGGRDGDRAGGAPAAGGGIARSVPRRPEPARPIGRYEAARRGGAARERLRPEAALDLTWVVHPVAGEPDEPDRKGADTSGGFPVRERPGPIRAGTAGPGAVRGDTARPYAVRAVRADLAGGLGVRLTLIHGTPGHDAPPPGWDPA
ncbi:hypothetical protein GCM10010106_29330 [Thermopolyspora flexuosa]|nr:hypothetical protein GCM10010106_29330 [Thermopolyspora flexuosa]